MCPAEQLMQLGPTALDAAGVVAVLLVHAWRVAEQAWQGRFAAASAR